MKIAVCCKFTPDTEDINPSANGEVNVDKAKWAVSDYDLQAIQAAADMTEACGAEAFAVTAGGARIDQSKLTKDLMSRGNLSALYRVVDDAVEDADAHVVAQVLAALVKRAGAGVALFGEGSSDRYQRVTGSLVAAALGWPCVNAVCKVDVAGGSVVAERDLEDGIEVVEVSAPCVLVVTSSINTPTIPNMKALLAAGKKPVETVALADLGVDVSPAVETVSSKVPEQPGRLKVVLQGSPDEVAAQLVEKLTIDKVL